VRPGLTNNRLSKRDSEEQAVIGGWGFSCHSEGIQKALRTCVTHNEFAPLLASKQKDAEYKSISEIIETDTFAIPTSN